MPGNLFALTGGVIDWRIVWTGFQTDAGSLIFDASLLVLFGGYWIATRRLERWRVRRTLAFTSGLFLIFVAVGSGLAAYDDTNPSVHVIQHVLLMMLAPPLIVLGEPSTLLSQVTRRPTKLRIIRLENSRPARLLSGPVGWFLYSASMPVYFLTPLYADSVHDELFHVFVHGWLLVVGYFYATSLIGIGARRRGYTSRLFIVLAGMPVEAALGAALMLWPWPLVSGESLDAAHSAGQVFWMTSMVGSGLMLALVLGQWAIEDERRTRRADLHMESTVVPVAEFNQPVPWLKHDR